jgi:Tfp pilus assembly protein PilF
LVTYIRLLFLPVNQNLDYDYPLSHSLFEPGTFLSYLFLLLIFASAVYLFIRSRKTDDVYGLLASFGILWFFITLSVESSIIPIRDVIFEHRLYLPGVGAVVVFSSAAFYTFDYMKLKLSPLVATCVLLVVAAFPLGIAAHDRNWVWKDDITLWEDVVEKGPDKARGHMGLGVAYGNEGRTDEAIEEYKQALRLKTEYPEAHYNLGRVYYSQGLKEEAIAEYKLAIRMKPDFVEAQVNLGTIYAMQGRTDEAIKELTEAIRLGPELVGAHINLGFIYEKQGLMDEAIEEYKKAVILKPDFAEAHINLGTAYYKQGRIDEAIEEYKEALRLKPDYTDAHYNLGLAFKRKGLKDEAIREFEEVLKIRPNNVKARQALETLTE